VEGRANEAVERFLAGLLGVPRRHVKVARGAASRGKLVEVEGLSGSEAEARLTAALGEAAGNAAEAGSAGVKRKRGGGRRGE
jgi:hypothetical protein